MYDQDLWVPEYCDILLHVVDPLAFRALVAAILHLLRSRERLQALIDIDVPRVPDCLARYLHRQVHEAVERVAFVVAFLAFDFTAKLSLEQVSDYRIVPRREILTPLLTLLVNWQLITVNLLVFRLLLNTVQLIVHTVQEEAEELLGVLLAVAAELPRHSTDLLLELAWSD